MRYRGVMKCKKCNKVYKSCNEYDFPFFCTKCSAQLIKCERIIDERGYGEIIYKKHFTENAILVFGYFKCFKFHELSEND